jgi:hypothetical protein
MLNFNGSEHFDFTFHLRRFLLCDTNFVTYTGRRERQQYKYSKHNDVVLLHYYNKFACLFHKKFARLHHQNPFRKRLAALAARRFFHSFFQTAHRPI